MVSYVFSVIRVLCCSQLRHGLNFRGGGVKTHVLGVILALRVANAILLNRLGVYIQGNFQQFLRAFSRLLGV